MVRRTFKILQQMLQDFLSLSDHFTILRSKGLNILPTSRFIKNQQKWCTIGICYHTVLTDSKVHVFWVLRFCKLFVIFSLCFIPAAKWVNDWYRTNGIYIYNYFSVIFSIWNKWNRSTFWFWGKRFMRHGNPTSKTESGIMTLFFELSNS